MHDSTETWKAVFMTLLLGIASNGAAQKSTETPKAPSTPKQQEALKEKSSSPLEKRGKENTDGLMDIEDIIKLINQNQIDLEQFEDNYKRDKAQITELESRALPQVTTSFRSLYQVAGEQEANPQLNTDAQRPSGDVHSWDIRLQSPLYGFGRLLNVFKQADKQEEVIRLSHQISRMQYFHSAILQYHAALLATQKVETAQKTLDYQKLVHQFTEDEYKAGAVPRVNFEQSQAAFKSTKANLLRAKINRDNEIFKLKKILDVPLSKEMQLSTQKGSLLGFLKVGRFSNNVQSLQTRILQAQKEFNELEHTRNIAEHRPMLSVFGSIGSALNRVSLENASGEDITQMGKELPDYSELFEPKNFKFEIGLSVDLTLWDSWKTRSAVIQAHMAARKTQRELEKIIKEQRIQRIKLESDLKVTQELIAALRESKLANETVYQQYQADYRAGQKSLTDVLEAQKTLSESEEQLKTTWASQILLAAQYRMLFGYRLNKVNLERIPK